MLINEEHREWLAWVIVGAGERGGSAYPNARKVADLIAGLQERVSELEQALEKKDDPA